MSYPKSLFKTVNGDGVERVAHNAEEEAAFTADGYRDMSGKKPEPPKPAVKPEAPKPMEAPKVAPKV